MDPFSNPPSLSVRKQADVSVSHRAVEKRDPQVSDISQLLLQAKSVKSEPSQTRRMMTKEKIEEVLGGSVEKYSGFNQYADPELQEYVNLKVAFQVLADFWGEGRRSPAGKKLEGASFEKMLIPFQSALIAGIKKKAEKGQSPFTPEEVKKLVASAESMNRYKRLVEYEPLLKALREDLPQLEEGQSLFIPGGWESVGEKPPYIENMGHAMVYQIEKTGKESYRFRIINSGDGLETYHPSKRVGYKKLYSPFCEWNGLSEKEISQENLWKALLDARIVPRVWDEERPIFQSRNIYEACKKHFPSQKYVKSNIPIDQYISPQRAGTCTDKAQQLIPLAIGTKKTKRLFKIEKTLATSASLYQQISTKKCSQEEMLLAVQILERSTHKLAGDLYHHWKRGDIAESEKPYFRQALATAYDLVEKTEALKSAAVLKNRAGGMENFDLTLLPQAQYQESATVDKTKEAVRSHAVEMAAEVSKPEEKPLFILPKPLRNSSELPGIDMPKSAEDAPRFIAQLKECLEVAQGMNASPREAAVYMESHLFVRMPIPSGNNNPWRHIQDPRQIREMLDLLNLLMACYFNTSCGLEKSLPEHILNLWKTYRCAIAVLRNNPSDPVAKQQFDYQKFTEVLAAPFFAPASGRVEKELEELSRSFEEDARAHPIKAQSNVPFFRYPVDQEGSYSLDEMSKTAEYEWAATMVEKEDFRKFESDPNSRIAEYLNQTRRHCFSDSKAISYLQLRSMALMAQGCATGLKEGNLNKGRDFHSYIWDDTFSKLSVSFFDPNFKFLKDDGRLAAPVSSQVLQNWKAVQDPFIQQMMPGTTSAKTQSEIQKEVLETNVMLPIAQPWSREKLLDFKEASQTSHHNQLALLVGLWEKDPDPLYLSDNQQFFRAHLFAHGRLRWEVVQEPHLLNRYFRLFHDLLEKDLKALQEKGQKRFMPDQIRMTLNRALFSFRTLAQIKELLAEGADPQAMAKIDLLLQRSHQTLASEILPDSYWNNNQKALILYHALAHLPKDVPMGMFGKILPLLGKYKLSGEASDANLEMDLQRNIARTLQNLGTPERKKAFVLGFVPTSLRASLQSLSFEEDKTGQKEVEAKIETFRKAEKELEEFDRGHELILRSYSGQTFCRFQDFIPDRRPLEALWMQFKKAIQENDSTKERAILDEVSRMLPTAKLHFEGRRNEMMEKWQKFLASDYRKNIQGHIKEEKESALLRIPLVQNLNSIRENIYQTPLSAPIIQLPYMTLWTSDRHQIVINLWKGTCDIDGQTLQDAMPVEMLNDPKIEFLTGIMKSPIENVGGQYRPTSPGLQHMQFHPKMQHNGNPQCSMDLTLNGFKGRYWCLERAKQEALALPKIFPKNGFSYWTNADTVNPEIIVCNDLGEKPFTPMLRIDSNGKIHPIPSEMWGNLDLELIDLEQNSEVLKLFRGLAPDGHFLAWKSSSGKLQRVDIPAAVDSQKGWLSFEYDGEKFRWRNDKRYFISPEQNLSDFISVPNFLVIENEAKDRKAFLLPKSIQEIQKRLLNKEKKEDFNLAENLALVNKNSNHLVVCSLAESGRARPSNTESALYLAYLHLLEGNYQDAVKLLQINKPCGRRYSEDELSVLQKIYNSNGEMPDHSGEAYAVRLYSAFLARENLKRFSISEGSSWMPLPGLAKTYEAFLTAKKPVSSLALENLLEPEEEFRMLHQLILENPKAGWRLRKRYLELYHQRTDKIGEGVKESRADRGKLFVDPIEPFKESELSENFRRALFPYQAKSDIYSQDWTWGGYQFANYFRAAYQIARSGSPDEKQKLLCMLIAREFENENLGQKKTGDLASPASFNQILYSTLKQVLCFPNEPYPDLPKPDLSYEEKNEAAKKFFSSIPQMQAVPSTQPVDVSQNSSNKEAFEQVKPGTFFYQSVKLPSHMQKAKFGTPQPIAQSAILPIPLARQFAQFLAPPSTEVSNPFSLIPEKEYVALTEEEKKSIDLLQEEVKAFATQEIRPSEIEGGRIVELAQQLTRTSSQTTQEINALEKKILDLANRCPAERKQEQALKAFQGSQQLLDMPQLIGMLLQGRKDIYQERTLLKADEIEELKAMTLQYVMLQTQRQQCLRSLKALQTVQQSDPAERPLALRDAALILQSEVTYNPQQNPEMAIYEYFADIRINPLQAAMIKHLCEIKPGTPPKFTDKVIQLIMGGGKSKVLLPILAFKAADGEHLSTLVVPEALYGSMKSDFAKTFQDKFGRPLEVIEFNRSQCTLDQLDNLQIALERAKQQGKVVLTRPTDLQSLNLMLTERHELIRQLQQKIDTEFLNLVERHRLTPQQQAVIMKRVNIQELEDDEWAIYWTTKEQFRKEFDLAYGNLQRQRYEQNFKALFEKHHLSSVDQECAYFVYEHPDEKDTYAYRTFLALPPIFQKEFKIIREENPPFQWHYDVIDKVKGILNLFQNSMVSRFDEFDSLFHTSQQTTFPIGKSIELDKTGIASAGDLYFDTLPALESLIHLAANKQTVLDERQYEKEVIPAVVDHVWKLHEAPLTRQGINKEQFSCYLTVEYLLIKYPDKAFEKELTEGQKVYQILKQMASKDASARIADRLAFYKNAIARELPDAFKATGYVKYGRSERRRDLEIAIPCDKSMPKEGALFRNPWETVFKTCQYYRQTWNDPNQTERLITYWFTQKRTSKKSEQIQNDMEAVFGDLSKVDLFDPIQLRNLTQKLDDKRRTNAPEALRLMRGYLEAEVLTKQVELFPFQLTANPQDLGGISQTTQGCSGTRAGENSWPTQIQCPPNPGVDGKTIAALARLENSVCDTISSNSPKEAILELVKKEPDIFDTISAWIDLGPLFKGWENDAVARQMLETFKELKIDKRAILSYHKNMKGESELALWKWGKNGRLEGPIPIAGTDQETIEKALGDIPRNKVLTFFPHAQIIGADIPQPILSKAIVSFGDQNTKDLLLQGVSRMRLLAKMSQFVRFVMPTETEAKVRQTLHIDPSRKIVSTDLVNYAQIVQRTQEERENFQGIRQQLHYLAKSAFRDLLLKTNDRNTEFEIYMRAREFFITIQIASLFEQFGAINTKVKTEEFLRNEITTLSTKLQKIQMPGIDVGAIKTKMDNLLDWHLKIKKTPLPKYVQASDIHGAGAEMEVQVEAKQQTEANEQQDMIRQPLIPSTEKAWKNPLMADLNPIAPLHTREGNPAIYRLQDLFMKTGRFEDLISNQILITENFVRTFEGHEADLLTKEQKSIRSILVVEEPGQAPKYILLSAQDHNDFASELAKKTPMPGRKIWIVEPHGELIQSGPHPWTPDEQSKHRKTLFETLLLKGDISRLEERKDELKQWMSEGQGTRKVLLLEHLMSYLDEDRKRYQASTTFQELMVKWA